MFDVPLSRFPEARPATGARQRETRLSSVAQAPVTAHVSAAAGQRRWTVVVPRRLTARAAQALADAEAAQSAVPSAPGPIRFRAQLTMFGAIATVASGLYVYSEKHAAASLDRQIAHAFQSTDAAHRQSELLRAEWALLNNPDRLHPLADRYLSLRPLDAAQFVKVADLHGRLPKVLYGPAAPVTDDEAAAPPIATRRLLAMAEAPVAPPAEPAAAPVATDAAAEAVGSPTPEFHAPVAAEQPAPTPVVTGPARAFRVLAHAGAVPTLVDADTAPTRGQDRSELASGETGNATAESGIVEDPVAEPHPPAEARTFRPSATPMAHQGARFAPQAVVPMPAPRLLARSEPPKPRLTHAPLLLRPELVHMLMSPHPLYTSTWTARPPMPVTRPALPPRHYDYGRSDPPHFLSVPQAPAKPAAPPQIYAEARPRAVEQPRQEDWTPPATYRPAPAYAYRPYWGGYNANPYGGYYYPQRPSYPVYQ